jgi:hypothetical protein
MPSSEGSDRCPYFRQRLDGMDEPVHLLSENPSVFVVSFTDAITILMAILSARYFSVKRQGFASTFT